MCILRSILTAANKDWVFTVPPLPAQILETMIPKIDWDLPDELIAFYKLGNAGEGSLPKQPWLFVLWGVEEILDTRNNDHYREHFNDYLLFGSNGSGEYFGQENPIVPCL